MLEKPAYKLHDIEGHRAHKCPYLRCLRLYQTAYPVKSRLMAVEMETLPVLSSK
jgi:hypothetical protein